MKVTFTTHEGRKLEIKDYFLNEMEIGYGLYAVTEEAIFDLGQIFVEQNDDDDEQMNPTVNAINELTTFGDLKRFVVKYNPTLEQPAAGKEFAYLVHDGKFLLIANRRTEDLTLHKWLYLLNGLQMLDKHGELGFDLSKATFVVVLGEEAFHTKEVDREFIDKVLAHRVEEVFGDRGHILRKGPNTEQELREIIKNAGGTITSDKLSQLSADAKQIPRIKEL